MSALIQICLAAIVSVSALGLTQTSSTEIPRLEKQGDSKSEQIDSGKAKTFVVALTAGKYATIHLEQHGSALVATLFDPQNKQLVQMDNLTGAHGPVIISTIAAVTGDYRLEVLAQDKWSNPAQFDVVLAEVRDKRPEDQTIIDAQQAFAEGRKYSWDGNSALAQPVYQRALELWTTAKDEHWQALTHFALSQTYGGRERKNAIKELEAVLAISERLPPNDWRIKAAALNDLGGHHVASGDLDGGINLLNDARKLFEYHKDRRGQASSLNHLAIANGRMGNLSQARELVQQALPLRNAENDIPGAINLINSLGGVSDNLGEPDKALEYFETALREWQKLGELSPSDKVRVASLLGNIAVANDKLGQWEKARDYYDQALAMFSERDVRRAAPLDSKGDLYASFGDLKKAREFYDEALRMLPAEKFDPDLKAGILVHVGQLFSLENDLPNAVLTFQQARDLNPQKTRLADVLTNLGVALAAQGKLEDAMAAYDQALGLQLELKNLRGQALTLQKRGETYNRLKQPAKATEDLKNALPLWVGLKDPRGRAATLNALAQAEQGRGNLKEALKYSDEAIGIVESQRTTLSSHQLRTSYFATQENYYELNVDLNMQLSKSGETEYVAHAFATAERARARVLLEALTEAGVDRINTDKKSDAQLSLLVEQLQSVKSKLAAKAQARSKLLNGTPNPTQVAILDKEIDTLSEKIDSLETEVRSRNPHFATLTKPQPATLKETQQQLDNETLLLEYALGDQRSYAWVVSQQSIAGFELAPRAQIEQAARRVTDVLTGTRSNETLMQAQSRIAKEYAEASAQLSKLVLEPITSPLGNKRLVVVRDGSLQFVPFAALPLSNKTQAGAGEAPLLSEHEIVYFPSASVLALQRRELANRKPAPHAVAVLANPVFEVNDDRVTRAKKKKSENSDLAAKTPPSDVNSFAAAQTRTKSRSVSDALRDVGLDGIRSLPFSLDEAIAIKSVVPRGEVFAALGFDATRETAMSPRLSQYQIIHFATHGIMNLEHPELSGIVLSLVDKNGAPRDGYLFLHDIYNLNLPAELVVLSACQTGVGKQVRGEGLIALTRGFMYAGAARLVASLWKVDDAATAALMTRFYEEMFTKGKKPAAALRAAQLDMRNTRRWNSPVYWAGFFIQGEWR